MRTLAAYPRRSPVTTAYVTLLLATHAWISYGLSPASAQRVLRYVSTNVTNLTSHPLAALFGSALFFDGTLVDPNPLALTGTLITLGLGVAGCLAWLEQRRGAWRAYGVFLAGHLGATLLTAGVVGLALAHGWYPDSVRTALDYGVSYGAEAILAVTTVALPRRLRPAWVIFVIAWPVIGGTWDSPLPDFTTVGHLTAAAIGFTIAAVRTRARRAPDMIRTHD